MNKNDINEIIASLNLTKILIIIDDLENSNNELENSNLNRENTFLDLAFLLGESFEIDLIHEKIEFTLNKNSILDNESTLGSAGIDENVIVCVEFSPYSESRLQYCKKGEDIKLTAVNAFNLTLIDKFAYIRDRLIECIEFNGNAILEFIFNSISTNSGINIYEEKTIQSFAKKVENETTHYLKLINEILTKIKQNRKIIYKRGNNTL